MSISYYIYESITQKRVQAQDVHLEVIYLNTSPLGFEEHKAELKVETC